MPRRKIFETTSQGQARATREGAEAAIAAGAPRADIRETVASLGKFHDSAVPAAVVDATMLAMQGDIDRLKVDRDDALSRLAHMQEKVAYQRQSIRDLEAKLRANGLT